MIRNHGKNPQLRNRMSEPGNNLRMSEVTALLGVEQMRRATAIIEDRRRVAAFYDGALHNVATTLSNLGMYRVDSFTAIISPTQSSILAVGQIRKRPWVDGTLVIKPTIMLNFTVDHRVADGAAAAAFLSKMVELIESSDGVGWNATKSSGRDVRER